MTLPSGTVTFLFTDIEGSTQLWQRHPNAMPAALSRHHAILTEAIGAHGGYVFQVVGDAFCAAFDTPAAGLAAALAAQRGLRDEPWGETGAILVRMALHTGTAPVQPGDYKLGEYRSGITLSRAARLLSAAHGGQVLLSAAAAELVRDHLPEEISLRGLGEHRLKDLVRPEGLFQAIAPDLPTAFPAPRTLDRHAHNLPVQATRFIGREREIAELGVLIRAQRLVTLTGPGGTGKTRLALQVAAEQVEAFAEGVFVVALESITDPALVLPAIAQVLGVRERPGLSLVEALADSLRGRAMLLVIDCFEQVLAAAPVLSELLVAAPRLKLLVASRSVLQLYGEVSYAISPLPLPDASQRLALAELSRNDCVALFVERARAARASFELNPENALAVVEICRQLDGLPLAIELAAARVRLLPPQKMVAQLQRRLPFLTGGPRDSPSRHQTLRGAIEWSYQLLAADQQRLFERLTVFAGGFTLEAAEAVLGENGTVLEGVSALVDQSLVYQAISPEGEPRFMMLVTLREYGSDQLQAGGDFTLLCQRHASYYQALLKAWAPQSAASLEASIARVSAEYGNFRAALMWTLAQATAEVAIQMCLGLYDYWYAANLREGQHWLKAALALAGAVPATVRAQALRDAATLSWTAGDFQTAREQAGAGLSLCRDEGLEQEYFWLLITFCRICIEQGDYPQAQAASAEATALSRQRGDAYEIVAALAHQGETALAQADLALARRAVGEAVDVSRAGQPFIFSAVALRLMGEIRYAEGDYAGAEALLRESFDHAQADNAWRALTVSLGTMAGFMAADADHGGSDRLRGARILAAVTAYHEAAGLSYSKAKREQLALQMRVARQALGSAEWDAAWAAGRRLTLEAATVEAKKPRASV